MQEAQRIEGSDLDRLKTPKIASIRYPVFGIQALEQLLIHTELISVTKNREKTTKNAKLINNLVWVEIPVAEWVEMFEPLIFNGDGVRFVLAWFPMHMGIELTSH